MISQPLLVTLLVAAGLALALFLFEWRRHPRLSPWQMCLWYFARFLVRFWWRAEQPKSLPLKPGQGAIIICNHRSSVDPAFVQTLVDRPLHFMVAREYCEHWALRYPLRWCEVIPTSRSGVDTTSIRTAIRLAAAGEVVGMLPEGRINTTEEFMLPVRPGAVLVALKARVPILPVYLDGVPYDGTPLSPFRMRARVRVVCGDLIDLSEYYGREDEDGLVGQLALQVVSQLAKLAGCDDFQPQLAGRKWRPES